MSRRATWSLVLHTVNTEGALLHLEFRGCVKMYTFLITASYLYSKMMKAMIVLYIYAVFFSPFFLI